MLKYEKSNEIHKHSNNNGSSNDSSSSLGKGFKSFWNNQIMERFIKANLFMICCIAAGLLLIVYLGAFSCEVSWILEAHGDLPFSAYILCAQYFIVFVATTILIHGLVTGISWGLFAWAVVIGLFAIPELVFVMIMTTQHWGLQSVHGLTELISYLVRLVINCFALICVIPTGLRWRREAQVLSQLSTLATRLQLQTPPPSAPITKADSRRSSKRLNAFENAGYQITEPTKINICNGSPSNGLELIHNNGQNLNTLFGSQNEFNASVFPNFIQQMNNGLLLNQALAGSTGRAQANNRAQSLMDLRCTLPGMYNPRYVLDMEDKNGKYFNITIDDLKNNLQDSGSTKAPSVVGSVSDPIYCSIEPKPPLPTVREKKGEKSPAKLARNCISLENLEGINKVQNDMLAYGNNLLQNYTQQQYYLAMLSGYINPFTGNINMMSMRRPSSMGANDTVDGINPGFSGTVLAQPMSRRNSSQSNLQYYSGFGYANYTNPYITANSKLSLGNESDDYRKYRDVAL